MTWDPDGDFDRISAAFDAHDKAAATAFTDELVDRMFRTADPYPANPAKKLLTTLRRKLCFAEMEKLADAMIQTGAGSTTVRRLYAQALLDQEHFTAALLVLNKLVEDTEKDEPGENAEARGLLGRAYKQLYVNAATPGVARNQRWLDQAASFYYGPYKRSPESFAWHGINVAAVAHRGVLDRVPLDTPGIPLPATLANAILQRIDNKDAIGTADIWDYGTAAEASIALGRATDALRWTRKYVKNANADAFEFASTLRQLEEVWGLPRAGSPAGSSDEEAILSLLRATILERKGGQVVQSAGGVRAELRELASMESSDLEKVFGADRFQSLDWYRRGLARCAAVGRIGRERSRGVGTGFLVKGSSLHPALGDALYLLTNRHVVSPTPDVSIAITPEDAIVTFEGLVGAEGQAWTVKRVVFTSPIEELDATLLELDRPVANVEPYPVAPHLPQSNGEQRVYVVGHPQGGGLSFSLQDNLLIAWDSRKVHYRTPTEPGSSGSPVFDDQWRLIALHHAGRANMPRLNGESGSYEANEGISILAIAAGLRSALGPV
jgi:S1-C subfamily serine protease